MFDDLMKQSASVMEAYKKMKEAEEQKKQETCTEGDDTGGDGSAYNKYLLAKTGDLPRSKKAYMKVEEDDDKDPCWDGYEMVGMKKKDGKEVPNCVPKKD